MNLAGPRRRRGRKLGVVYVQLSCGLGASEMIKGILIGLIVGALAGILIPMLMAMYYENKYPGLGTGTVFAMVMMLSGPTGVILGIIIGAIEGNMDNS